MPRNDRGVSALALVLVIVSSFGLMTAGVGLLVTQKQRQMSDAGLDLRCRYAAYSAVQLALHELNGNPRYDPLETITDVPMPGDDQITYSLRVANNYEGTYPNPTADGVTVPNGMCYITAQGDVKGIPTLYSAGLASMGWRGDSMFRHAAIGTRLVTMVNGCTTDSYRTSTGVMTAQDKDRRGTILTNSIQPDSLVLEDSIVKGYAVIGPLGDPAVVIKTVGTGKVLETIQPAPHIRVNTGLRRVPRYIPPYNPNTATSVLTFTNTDQVVEPGAYQSITQVGGVLRLKAGVYYIKDFLELRGGARLELDPTQNYDAYTSLYVGERVSFLEGSTVNETIGKAASAGAGLPGGPMTLRLFFVGTGVPGFSELNLRLDASSRSWLVAAGKNLKVNVSNNSELWGAVKGSEVNLTNTSKIHYDKDLYNQLKPGMMGWSLQGLMTDSGDLPIEDTGWGE